MIKENVIHLMRLYVDFIVEVMIVILCVVTVVDLIYDVSKGSHKSKTGNLYIHQVHPRFSYAFFVIVNHVNSYVNHVLVSDS